MSNLNLNSNHANSDTTSQSVAIAMPSGTALAELEFGCIDLLCKMEFYVSEVKGADPVDRHEVAVEVSRKMISEMKDFSAAYFIAETLAAINSEFAKVSSEADVMETLIANRSFTGMIRRTFGGADPDEATFCEASQNVFKAVKRSIVTVLFHAIQMAGAQSSFGKQLDQSTLLIVSELESIY